MKRTLLVVDACLPAVPAHAQDGGWSWSATPQGWLSGSTASAASAASVEIEKTLSDVRENRDMAFFGAFEARCGRWVSGVTPGFPSTRCESPAQ